MKTCAAGRGGGEIRIEAKRDPSVSNSTWESIFQTKVDFQGLRTRRAPQESDQSSTDFVLFRGVVFERGSFSPSFFHFS